MADTWTTHRQRLEEDAKLFPGGFSEAALARIDRTERALEAAEAAITQWQTDDCQCPWIVGKCARCVATVAALAAIREAKG